MSHDGFLGLCFLPLTAIKKKKKKRKGKKRQEKPALRTTDTNFHQKAIPFYTTSPQTYCKKKNFSDWSWAASIS